MKFSREKNSFKGPKIPFRKIHSSLRYRREYRFLKNSKIIHIWDIIPLFFSSSSNIRPVGTFKIFLIKIQTFFAFTAASFEKRAGLGICKTKFVKKIQSKNLPCGFSKTRLISCRLCNWKSCWSKKPRIKKIGQKTAHLLLTGVCWSRHHNGFCNVAFWDYPNMDYATEWQTLSLAEIRRSGQPWVNLKTRVLDHLQSYFSKTL